MITNSNSNFSQYMNNDNSGMLSSLEVLNSKDKVDFINKLFNMMMIPTLNIMSCLNNDKLHTGDISLIMTVYASVHVDCDLYNLTILEDNVTTKILQNTYDNMKFYMLNSGPVIDKKTKDVCILLEFYKKAITEPLEFLNDINGTNPEIMAYLYMKELVALAQKNYRNKFTLANRARVYLYEHNKNMPRDMIDQAAVSLAKMAMEYHVNSMLIDNFKEHDRVSRILSSRIEYIKNNQFVLYDKKYNYKMTHLEILEALLEDANIEFLSMAQNNQQQQNDSNNSGDNSGNIDQTDNDISDNNDENEGNSPSDNNQEQQQQSQEESNDENSANSSSGSSGSGSNNSNGLDRNSSYDRQQNDASLLKITFKSNKSNIVFMKMPSTKDNDRYDRLDNEDERVIDNYQDYIDYTVSKMRGSGMQNILANIGCPIEIDMSWEEKIIRYVDDMTNISTSHKEIATWGKINIYTRHVATLPGRKKLPEAHPTIYLMFDQSGSMSNHVIRKINYVIQYFYNKKYRVNVFVHDDCTTADDVKIYEFNPMNAADKIELDKLVESRVMSGGTSHKGVFDVMAQYIEEVKYRGNKKYNSHYVLIASDLYSDIDEIYHKYEWVKLLGKNIIALTDSNDIKLPFGQTIVIS